MLSEQGYLTKFESRDLGPENFDHRGHLYMAWLHLSHYPLDEANHRVCNGIQDLAQKYGVPEKYNRTVLTRQHYRLSSGLQESIRSRRSSQVMVIPLARAATPSWCFPGVPSMMIF